MFSAGNIIRNPQIISLSGVKLHCLHGIKEFTQFLMNSASEKSISYRKRDSIHARFHTVLIQTGSFYCNHNYGQKSQTALLIH